MGDAMSKHTIMPFKMLCYSHVSKHNGNEKKLPEGGLIH